MRLRFGLIAFLIAVGITTAARAVDVLIPGKVGLVKSAKIAKLLSKNASPVLLPMVGSANDPTLVGAEVQIFDTLPSGGGSFAHHLDKTGWKGLGNPAGSKGYKYTGSGASPPDSVCTSVQIKATKVKVNCRGSGVTLTTPFSGDDGVIVGIPAATAAALRYCADLGGVTKKNDTTALKRKNAPAPGTCPFVLPTPTATQTVTRTATLTNTPANAATATNTPADTVTRTATNTAAINTPADTATRTATATHTAAATATNTPANTATSTATWTPTITLTPTPTPTIPPICQSVLGLPTIAEVPFKITQGSTQCGGASLSSPAPAPPFSGSVADASHTTIDDLSLGCLYAGVFPGLVVPDGSVSMLSVVGVNLLPPSVTLGGSAGHDSTDCTLGSGPGSTCVDGSPGLNAMGQCATDTDCSGTPGSCQPTANCYFGPPIPVSNGAASACVVNAFLTDLCGSVGLLPPQANLATALSSRVYFSGHPSEPCPRCVGGVCDGGDRVGLSCTAVGSAQTSIDCPPPAIHFFGALTVVLPSLTTGTSTLPSSGGTFCPGQDPPGAFGQSAARSISEVGVPPGGSTNALALNLAATFCVPATGTTIDFFAQLPAAGALSAAGQLDLSSVLP